MKQLHGVVAIVILISVGTAFAVPPPEVTNLRFTSKTALGWDAQGGIDGYNVYRGDGAQLLLGTPPRCHLWNVATNSATTSAVPVVGKAYVYLVTANSNLNGEGTPGNSSSGAARALYGHCSEVMNHHLLNRITFGWNEWVRDRLNTLGPQAFLNEQLSPASISEADNSDLNTRMSALSNPQNITDLANRQIVQATYARRQLEQIMAVFWANHFNTDYSQVYENLFSEPITSELQTREMENFRADAFNGTFRDILEHSALSPAMIFYLDTSDNVAGKPNENYGRELMELHTMGVNGGYTQTDVREVARAFTGWTVCRKTSNNQNDPLAPCAIIGGKYVANFDITKHDCGAKTIFSGTPQQFTIASTCNGQGQPTSSGVNDLYTVLDAVAAHPSTPRFISTKLLQKFITEAPSQAQIDAVVAVWNSSGGNLKQILTKVLEFSSLMNPDIVGNKVRTPIEQFAAVYRATRADTSNNNISTLYNYLARMQMTPHAKAEPTGYSELAKDWVNTNDMLERQNFAYDVTTNAIFMEDIIPLLNSVGLSSASPPSSIVDFYSGVLFGGALTPADRQRTIDFLSTNDAGVPAPVTDPRILQTVAFMMGFPQMEEQ